MIDSVSASIRAPWQFGCLACPLLLPSIATYPPGVKTCCLHGCILSRRLLFFSFHQKDNNDASSHTSPTHSFSHCVVSATSLGNKHRLQLTHFGDFLDALLTISVHQLFIIISNCTTFKTTAKKVAIFG